MEIKKTCLVCGKEFSVQHWRINAKYCSASCRQDGLKGKPNVICTNCGKSFHMKPIQQKRYKRTMGYFCCKECENQYKSKWFTGENNHQYGLKGDKNASFKGMERLRNNNSVTEIEIYAPEHPHADQRGRVLVHHLVVEQYYSMFKSEFFDIIDGKYILNKKYVVHHKDGNHNNNDISNLEIMTRGEHTSHHNRINPMPRDDKNGQFITKTK